MDHSRSCQYMNVMSGQVDDFAREFTSRDNVLAAGIENGEGTVGDVYRLVCFAAIVLVGAVEAIIDASVGFVQ